ncbi:MAG: ATP-binding cassette domain-containing protein [Lactobacillaceae bacterium]|nr:ATP-binding cassette domain-containing protein [Lactobacillaceae bacterium]
MTKRLISEAIAHRPDVLMLDEPTTHLDITQRLWLEKIIKTFRGTVILISHNRQLLQNVCDVIWEFKANEILEYAGGYENYLAMTNSKNETDLKRYTENRKEKARLKKQAQQQQNRANNIKKSNPNKLSHGDRHVISVVDSAQSSLSRAGKNISKRADQLDDVQKPFEQKKLKLQNTNLPVIGKPLLKAMELDVVVAGRTLIQKASLQVKTGDKIAIVGPNGAGKSSFIHSVLQDNKAVTRAQNLKVGISNQDLKTLQIEQTALENVMIDSSENEQVARDFLGAMGIRLAKVNQVVGTMSGGEQLRVMLVKALLTDAPLLVLDEPTNYLDIRAIEALTEYLQVTTQAVLLISHDEQFVDDVAKVKCEILHEKLQLV